MNTVRCSGSVASYATGFFLAFLFVACSGKKTSEREDPVAQEPETEEADIHSEKIKRGEKAYHLYCLSCHQSDGSGVPLMYPPLARSEWVNGDRNRLISTVLFGISGPIEVNGETYNGIMPEQSYLTDDQVADILTYVKNSFGNNGGEINSGDVAGLRTGKR